ncbi:MAG: MBL fold metallo-hydrolase, partial [Candidatus Marinimicrobia bacterium]|nr:MBL fold metallo-hydrolase [Candidatus Neomarinimicrobiota bacterium]
GTREMDTFIDGNDTLNIHFYGHGSLMLDYNGLRIYVDPVGRYADYASLPPADIILITHEHGDHLDPSAVREIADAGTRIVSNAKSAQKLEAAKILKNGASCDISGLTLEAVPAYNTTKGRKAFHPKGNGNGYVLTLGNKRVYIAGDTEDIPELKKLKAIDIAFLPVNQPYTMTPEQAARAARIIRPAVLYPYHYGTTDVSLLKDMLKSESGIEVRIRKLS